MNDDEKHRTNAFSAEDMADFVDALIEDYAQRGRAALAALRLGNPMRFLIVVAAVLYDERYAEPLADQPTSDDV